MTIPNPETNKESIPFYPDHVKTEFMVVIGIVVLVLAIGIFGLFNPIGQQAPADAMDTPAHVKPEWYFLGLYQLLKYIPKTSGALIPVIAVLIVLLWPFFDKKDDTRKASRIRLVAAVVGMVVLIALTIWGEVS
jgi:quinol-cytochrome oxidoreductase complex cytochrome b subunit